MLADGTSETALDVFPYILYIPHVTWLKCSGDTFYSFSGRPVISMSEWLVSNMNDEHNILNYYNLTTPFPTGWPTEKDDSEDSEDEKRISFLDKNGVRRSKSRYSALERSGSDRRSLVPGSQKLRDGQENLVQKDEPDPLGGTDSVVKVLRKKGLPVEEDQRLSKAIRPSQLSEYC